MFKRIFIATAIVSAFAFASLGSSRTAEAGPHHRHGCGYDPYYHPRAAYVPHPRSAYYRAAVAPVGVSYGAYYGGPAYYGVYGRDYSRGPAFRLSIGF